MSEVIEINSEHKRKDTELQNYLVSICIPAYNSEQYLIETLDCLFNQTYKNIEVIVVDDGSSDNTALLISTVKDPRLKFERQVNKGAAAARNKAFELSSGQFIKFLDADDLINPTAIEQQLYTIIDKPDCIASSKWGRFFNSDLRTFTFTPENVWKDLPGIDWIVNSLIDHGSNMTQPGIFLIPRNLIEKVGGWDESLSLIDDFEFMTKVIVQSKEVLFCEQAILMYRSGIANSLSGLSSRRHMESAFNAQMTGIRYILAAKDNNRSRLACANSLQLWAYTFYPQHLDLYNKVQAEINRLGGSNVKLKGGGHYMLLVKLVGWKFAKKMKLNLLCFIGKKDFNYLRKLIQLSN